jgi:sulfur carrier protein
MGSASYHPGSFLATINPIDMVEVSINQEHFQLSDAGTLADVLPLLHILHTDGIAIAVNDTVIPKGEWQSTLLRQDDKIFIIRATQGG